MSEAAREGRHTLLLAALLSVLLIGIFWPTVATMVHQWGAVETYSHGFLILPISLWLVWREREMLLTIQRRAAPVALLFVMVAGAGWMLARLLGVQVIEQLAFVSLWIMALWALLGHALLRQIWFPMLFLLTMVPMGDGLLEPMMSFTADFTVWMLEMTGIPVYREGLNFVVPSGNWSVVEACSGVRYLIASVTLGLLYAHLTYHSIWRKLLFVLVSVVTPILANGLRAYMIVMIGHLSDMKLAVGVDHLIYGWVFFGLVMLLLFWLGGYFIDQPPQGKPHSQQSGGVDRGWSGAVTVMIGVVSFSVGLHAATATLSGENAELLPPFTLPSSLAGWERSEASLEWPVAVPAADQTLHATFEKQGRRVAVRLGIFLHQRQGHEVISTDNRLLAKQGNGWQVTGQGRLPLAGDKMPFHQLTHRPQGFLIGTPAVELHAASWYRLGDRDTANDYLGKYYQGLNLLTAGRTDGMYVIIATDAGSDSKAVLRQFSGEALPFVWSAWNAYLQDAGRQE